MIFINEKVLAKTITDRVAARFRLNKAVSAEICRSFLREIENEMIQGNTIVLPNFGTFKSVVQESDPDKTAFGRTYRDRLRFKFVPSSVLIRRGIEYIEVNKK